MRWNPDQLAEYMTQRQQRVGDHDPDAGKEAKLQAKCLKYCREHGYPVFHDWSKKRNQPGWPDLFCFLPEGRVILIELKAAGGKLRKEQQALKINLSYLGHGIHVVKSYKRFLEIMKGILVPISEGG